MVVLLQGRLWVVPRSGVGRQVLGDRVHRRGKGDGDQRAGDAGHDHPDADRDDHAERVHRDEPPHQERLEHVALDLLDQDHAAQHQQRGDRPLVDQRDQHGDGAGDEGADHGNEGAEEHQHPDRHHERHAEHRGHDHDADRVDGSHEHRGSHELGERDPRDPARTVDQHPARARRSRTNQDQMRWPSARKK